MKNIGSIGKLLACAAAALACLAGGIAFAADTLDREVTFSIESQALDTALLEFSKQANVQLMLAAKSVGAQQSQGISGRHAVNRALSSLLKGTGLTYTAIGNTITIEPTAASYNGEGQAESPQNSLRLAETRAGSQTQEGKVQARAADASAQNANSSVEEVIVTATKRAESVQDIPVSITALSGEEMEKKGMTRLDDYLRVLPGVNFLDLGNSLKRIVFRGIGTDPEIENLTSGTYFGEVPVSAAVSHAAFTGSDIRMIDMERIEVLRGPQGSLYGSGAMGGIVRQIPRKPDLTRFQGDFAAGYSSTARLGGGNNMQSAVLNIPVVEGKLAVRAVGYRYFDSGFYENVAGSNAQYLAIAQTYGGLARNEGRVGDGTTTGGRFALAWQLSERFGADVTFITQREEGGRTEAMQGLQDYQQTRLALYIDGERGSPDKDSRINIGNVALSYDLGPITLLSSSSLIDKKADGLYDISVFYNQPLSSQEIAMARAFTHELRASSQLGGPFEFVAGLYYEDIEDVFTGDRWWSGAAARNTFSTDLHINHSRAEVWHQQKAVFGEASYALTQRFTVRGGARFYDYAQHTRSYSDGSVFGNGTITQLRLDESGSTFKGSVDFKATDNAMIYAQWAEGFRLGRPLDNSFARSLLCDANQDGRVDGLGFSSPEQVNSDSIESYELGAKLALAGGRVVLNSAVYHIDWTGIPLGVRAPSPCNTIVTLNAGKAFSEGVEFEGSARLTRNLRTDFSAAYTNAELAEDAPNLGVEGDRLPGTPKYKASLGLQYDFDIDRFEGFARADYSYISGFRNNITHDFESSALEAGNYSQVNLRTGLSVNRLSGELFVTNLLNEDAMTWIGLRFRGTSYFLRPRTIGVNLKYSF